MAKLMVGMGLPGSGKSTNLTKLAQKYAYEYISFDTVREAFGLSRAESSTPAVFEHIGSRMLELYRAGKTVVLDGTFLNGYRRELIAFARANGVKRIQGIFVDTPEEHAWARVQARSAEEKTTRKLFDGRVDHLKKFPPQIDDGFDAIFVLNEVGELVKAKMPREREREFNPRRRLL
ncbi:ATP-binding protein [Patescibacteria group bacterium]|nr:MAG: ATP-binding protein [Patescibacteria group bacterium]